jgi:stage II sporulation protein D
MVRRFVFLLLLLAALVPGGASARVEFAAGFTPPALKGTPQFVISGHGWGHGIGMSQYGAQGYAQNGYTYDQILSHYYPGTELGAATLKTVRVLLAQTKSVTIASLAAWKLKDASGTITTLAPGKVTLNAALTFTLPGETTPRTFTGPLTFTAPASGPLTFKKQYRGTFTVTSDGKKLTLVNNVPLEQYLYGVVPSEMPSTWLDEALKVQAVAARSYAIAMRKTSGAFDVYPDTRSQVYGGIEAESDTTSAAIDATAGEILTYDGSVATTYFSSTSGGKTAAIADVWDSDPVPYLVSVADPYDTISPYHDWGPLPFTAAKLKKALKAPGRLLDVQTDLNASGRVSDVTAVGDRGERVLAGSAVQKALGLRSTWFRVGVLALDPAPATPATFGVAITLTGIGRGLPGLVLEQRPRGTTDPWTTAQTVTPGVDGALSIRFKAGAPADYRLRSGKVASAVATLLVAPRVKLAALADSTGFTGTVRPKLAGAPVQIQQLDTATGKWTTLVTTELTEAGQFDAAADVVVPGTYRARVVAGQGWAVAVSAKLTLE